MSGSPVWTVVFAPTRSQSSLPWGLRTRTTPGGEVKRPASTRSMLALPGGGGILTPPGSVTLVLSLLGSVVSFFLGFLSLLGSVVSSFLGFLSLLGSVVSSFLPLLSSGLLRLTTAGGPPDRFLSSTMPRPASRTTAATGRAQRSQGALRKMGRPSRSVSSSSGGVAGAAAAAAAGASGAALRTALLLPWTRPYMRRLAVGGTRAGSPSTSVRIW